MIIKYFVYLQRIPAIILIFSLFKTSLISMAKDEQVLSGNQCKHFSLTIIS